MYVECLRARMDTPDTKLLQILPLRSAFTGTEILASPSRPLTERERGATVHMLCPLENVWRRRKTHRTLRNHEQAAMDKPNIIS